MPAVVDLVAVTGDAEIVLTPEEEPKKQTAAPEPTQTEIAPSGPVFNPEEGAPGYRVREIVITPPTFNDELPVMKKAPAEPENSPESKENLSK